MADANKTLITRAEVTSLITAATNRVRLTLDGQNVELGNTGWRDVSGSLDPTKVETIAAGQLVVIRTGNVVTVKVSVTPTASGNVQITEPGKALGAAFAPDTTVWSMGRGGPIGVATAGTLYINPAVAGQAVAGSLTYVVDNTWPTALPGVELGQPLVV